MTSGKQAGSFYKDILDYMLEGCQILDFNWHYLYLNSTAEYHNRRPNQELLGKVYTDMWPGVEQTEVYRLLKACMEQRTPQAMENEFTFPDGSQGWFELRISPVPEGIFIMSLDISDRKQAEDVLRKTEEQLRQAQKLEAIGQLAGGVAHDFNNMLGVILGHVEMAMGQLESSHKIYRDLQQIHQASLKSADLTRQLLAFARRQTIDPKVLDVNKSISSMLKLLRRLIGEDITLQWKPDKKLHRIKIDPSQVEQVLANLCVNARDAIGSIGQISIETQNVSIDKDYCADHQGFIEGDFVVISVSDNGSGMDREAQQKIFEPFFTTKAMGQGTGLGLATVYGIVKQNRGFINVYSEPGYGSSFNIYLPGYLDEAEELPLEKGDPLTSSGNETVLLVEDDADMLEITRVMLENLGYHVLPAHSPSDAIHLAASYPSRIHLLITDVIMPEMTGPDLAERIMETIPGIGRLFVSGYTANVITHRGVLKKDVYFLAKPFSRKQLGDKVREVLDEVLIQEEEQHSR
jgi:PAS domain S-box-containing protein